MKYLRFTTHRKAGFAVASAMVSMGLFGLDTAHAQMLLKPAAGSTIYESTEHGGGPPPPFSGAFAFDGTFNATQTNITNTGPTAGFAANGDSGDKNPILAFNLSSSFTIDGIGYAQFNGPNDTLDLVSRINVFSLTLAQYNAYISSAALVTSGTAGGTNSNKPAPTSFISQGSVTGLVAGGYTLFGFNANSTTITGQYFVVQFVGNTAGTLQNPGALEFELRAAPVPEPSSYAFLALGLGGAVLVVRRRRLTA